MRARPTDDQLLWHDREIGMFIHFGLYTYRDRTEWQTSGDPAVFHPTALDAEQWVETARSLGARYVVLTAKHADGFCLWQSDTTEYGVKSSPWKNGSGDVVADMAAACKNGDMDLGIYLSPADDHFGVNVGGIAPDPAAQRHYDEIYRNQAHELLTRYGPVCEVWFDGSCVTDVRDILADHAPHAMVFQSANATIRWVGNEHGYAPYPCWNAVSADVGRSGMATAEHGDPDGDLWLPIEVDTTIRNHYWMWEEGTEDTLKSLDELIEVYYRSVGHGAVLLLNSNPDTTGRIPERDAARAAELGAEVRRRFSTPVAESPGFGTDVELDLGGACSIDHVVAMEDISNGEIVRTYAIQGFADGRWDTLATGSAIGHKKIDFFPPRKVSKIRLDVLHHSGERARIKLAAYSCGTVPTFDRSEG